MDSIKFKPRVFVEGRLISLIAVIIITIIFSVTLLPKSLSLYNEYPSQDTIIIPIIIISVIILSWIVVISIAYFSVKNKKISVKDKLLFYYSKSPLSPESSKTINLDTTEYINERKQTSFIYAGKSLVPIVNYWLIFIDKNQSKQEISLAGWDLASINNLLYYLKGKFSHIKIDSSFYHDSPEVLAGLNKIINK